MSWMAGWSYRKKITVTNNVASELTNYQVLLTLTDGVNLDFDKVLQANGYDLQVTDSDGTTLLTMYRQNFTAGTSAKIWFKLPTIGASSTADVYLYYGNASAEDTSTTTTFIRTLDNLRLLWHSDENSGTALEDASDNNLAGVKKGDTEPAWTAGKFGYANDFDSSNDYIRWSSAGNELMPPNSPRTFLLWYKPDTYGDDIFVLDHLPKDQIYFAGLITNADHTVQWMWQSIANQEWITSNDTVTTGVWNFIAVGFSGTQVWVSINAGTTKKANVSSTTGKAGTSDMLRIGESVWRGWADGIIDELAVFLDSLSDAEIADVYANYLDAFGSDLPDTGVVRQKVATEPSGSYGDEEEVPTVSSNSQASFMGI